MNFFHWLLLAFLIVPLGEIWVLIEVGSIVGAVPTIGLVVLTAVVGAALIRWQGFSTIRRVQASVDAGRVPALELLEGAVLLVAGALLLTPGFLTDSVGFLCLVPPLRRHVLLGLIERHVVAARTGAGGRAPDGSRVIEGEYLREDD